MCLYSSDREEGHLVGKALHELGFCERGEEKQGQDSGDDEGHLPAAAEGNGIGCYECGQVLGQHAHLVTHRTPDGGCVYAQAGSQAAARVLCPVKERHLLQVTQQLVTRSDEPRHRSPLCRTAS